MTLTPLTFENYIPLMQMCESIKMSNRLGNNFYGCNLNPISDTDEIRIHNAH